MQHTINALRYRKVYFTLPATAVSLAQYGETLRADLDEYSDGRSAHAVTLRHTDELVEVTVRMSAEKQLHPVSVETVGPDKIAAEECEISAVDSWETITFVRYNNQFNFSPAFAQNDANGIIGFVLSAAQNNLGEAPKNKEINDEKFQSA